jgi:putative transposase
MADEQSMTVREALGKVLGDEHADVLRESVRMVLGELMEAQVAELAGAERYEHSPERVAQRNGYRQREWDTRVGTVELAIPRLRTGSYLAELPGAAPSLRAGAGGGRAGGLREWRLDA